MAAKLRAATRRSGRPFKDVVNDTLRRGLASPKAIRAPFRIQARDLGESHVAAQLDDIGGVLESVEGPRHR